MSEKRRERVLESFTLPAMGEQRVIRGAEALKAAGFNEKWLAVIPAECAMGGIVNGNRMIYIPEELAAEHTKLSMFAKDNYVAGEAGHPEGARTWNVAVRFLGGDTEVTESGAVKTKGLFALLDTSAGRDIMTCYEDGMPVGVSLRGWAYKEPHTLDDKSPYTALNPAFEGQTVWLRSGLELETYDPVPVPAFNTFFVPKGEAVAALERLKRDLRDTLPAVAGSESEMDPKTETPAAAPKIETVEALKTAHGPLVEAIVKDAVAEAIKAERDNDPLAGLDKSQIEALTTMASVLKGKGPKAAQEAATEAVSVIRERVASAEAQNAENARENAALKARLDAMEAKAAKAEAGLAIRDALDAKVKGVAAGEALRAFVMEDVEAGRISTAEEAAKMFDRLAALQTGAAPPPAAKGDTSASAGADNGSAEAPAPAKENAGDDAPKAPGLLGQRLRLSEALKQRRGMDATN